MSVSALILTLNEEITLPHCLNSLSWCDDIVVLDSYSSDRTEVVAKEGGARFILRHFDNYATQRNFALNEIEYKYPWLLMVDADEQVSPELAKEMETTMLNSSDEMALYRMRRKDYFMGRWIRYSSGYPTWFGRLARVGRVHVERAINEEYHTNGRVGFLQHHLLHFPFSKGFDSWIEKHNRYSRMEAESIRKGDFHHCRLSDFLHSDPSLRRRAFKSLVYSLPGRPIIIFWILYFLRGGFLDGRAGLTYCLLRSIYEYLIDCKVEEFKRREQGLIV